MPGRDDSSTTRSASRIASRTSWVTNRIVVPVACQTRSSSALQHVAGDGVERRERLVHEQHPRPALGLADRPSSRPAHGPATRAGACRPTARAAACRPARRAAPATSSSSARSRRSRRPWPASCSASSTLRRAVSHGSSAASWNMNDGRAVPTSTSPIAGRVQVRDEVEQRRLAAARRAEQADELARLRPAGRCRAGRSRRPVPWPNVLPTAAQRQRGRTGCGGVGAFDGRGHRGHPCALSSPAASTVGWPAAVSTLFSGVTSTNPARFGLLLRRPRP